MPRIPHSILLRAYKRSSLLPLVLRGSRSLPSAINELRWLTEHVREISARKGLKLPQEKLLHLCRRRSKGEPLQYILGSQPFGDLEIICCPGVLIPRSETEAYTMYLAKRINSQGFSQILTSRFDHGKDFPPLRILDLCTGTGCIPLLLNNLLSESVQQLEIHGWDISEDAVALAQENLAHNSRHGYVKTSHCNRVDFGVVDIFDDDNVLQSFLLKQSNQKINNLNVDVIISNPPYISQEAFRKETMRSVRNWEPKLALVPAELPRSELLLGVNAADIFYQRLLTLHSDVFKSRLLLMEVGDEAQAIRVAKMALNHCNPPDAQTTKTRNHVEIWKDSPEMDELEELNLGGNKILIRGSGNFRAVLFYYSSKEAQDWER